MDQRKRIAIYGGTFDPVHAGHLEIAKGVSQLFEIDEFLFVPARMAPHKQDAQVSSAIARYAMLALATQGDPHLCISTFELEGGATQYTVDTLEHFRAEFGKIADLFFVMGADSWVEITSWREWQKVLSAVNHIVVTRPGYEFAADHGERAMVSRVADVRGETRESVSQLVEPGRPKIFVTDAVMRDVSATAVRQAARENRIDDLIKLTTPAVAEYITKYRLYRNRNEA
jgi:nicotinate-nucleotide adenylyltransferase